MLDFIKKLTSKIKVNRGYTLAELSISTSIIAILAVGALAIMQKKNASDQEKLTIERLAKIDSALHAFIDSNHYVPCPAIPTLTEDNTNFGKSEGMTVGGTVTSTRTYDPIAKKCSNNGLLYGTGAVPVRTLGLSDEYMYDGWERKFTYRSANASGDMDGFTDYSFNGDIRVVTLKGTNATRIDDQTPDDQGAIYVVISHGANGASVAYGKGTTTAPSSSGVGVEAPNTNHLGKTYVQDKKTKDFDDILIFGVIQQFIKPKLIASPIDINEKVCDNASALVGDGRAKLDNYANQNGSYVVRADKVFRAAKIIDRLCKNRPVESRDPSKVPGLVLWLDGADESNIFSDATCSTTITNSGSVGCWRDKSTNVFKATSSGTARPIYQTTVLNGKSSIVFDGSNDSLVIPHNSNLSIIGDMSIFAAISVTDFAISRTIIAKTGSTNPSRAAPFKFEILNSGGNVTLTRGNDAAQNTFQSTLPVPNIPVIISATMAGTSVKHFLNGKDNGVGTLTGTIADSNNPVYVGYRSDAASKMLGSISEIIMYNSSLSPDKRSRIEYYLADKWGIVLDNPATVKCSEGLVFIKDKQNPFGTCKCPFGTALAQEIDKTSGCALRIAQKVFSGCAPIDVPPTYTKTPNLRGLGLWMDAADCSTITLVNNTNKISEWRDKSNSAAVATQSVTANQPTYKLNNPYLNTLSTISFDGNTNYLETNAVDLGPTPARTLFFIFKPNAASNPANKFLYREIGTNSLGKLFMAHKITGELSAQAYNGTNLGVIATNYSTIANNKYMLTYTYKNNEKADLYVNGALYESSWDTGFSFASQGAMKRGIGNYNALTQGFNGDIGEVLLYSYALPSSERDEIEQYLTDKWDIFTQPTDYSALEVWLDASDEEKVYEDSACSIVAAYDKSIGCWADKSGNNQHVVQTTTKVKPTFRFGRLNELPVVEFDSSDDYLQTAAPITMNATLSVYVVGQYNNSPIASNNSLFIELSSNANSNDGWYLYGYGQKPWYIRSNGSTISGVNNLGWIDTLPTLVSFYNDNDFSSSNGAYYKNDTLVASVTGSIGAQNFTDNLFIGKRNDPSSSIKTSGSIGEIVIYDSPLDSTKRANVRHYLIDKWGIK